MRRCGDIAIYHLLSLWSFTAQNKPDGNLKGLDKEDIEIACNAEPDTTNLYQTLIELGFLEQDKKGNLFVHDWDDHNGYACHAKERSERGKRAAEARWGKGKNNA